MSNSSRVKIVSDGSIFGTSVFVDGVPLPCTRVSWTFDANQTFATVDLTVFNVPIEAIGKLRTLVEPGLPGGIIT